MTLFTNDKMPVQTQQNVSEIFENIGEQTEQRFIIAYFDERDSSISLYYNNLYYPAMREVANAILDDALIRMLKVNGSIIFNDDLEV